MILIAKIATIIGWIVILANWVTPFAGDFSAMLHYSGLGLIAAHLIEVVVFLPKAKRLNENTALHALQLFIFGYAHNMAIDAKLEQNTPA